MNGMQSKAIVFVGGSQYGVDKFEKIIKSKYWVKNVNLDTAFDKPEDFSLEQVDVYEAIEEVFSECSYFSHELVLAGDKIREFISHPKAQVLVLHNTTPEIRRLMVKVSDKLENVDTFRIFFNCESEGKEFDYNVNPDSENFTETITKILQNEVMITA